MKSNKEMVDALKKEGYIKSKKVSDAFLAVDRREFLPPKYREQAYVDAPIPIEGGMTTSAPHIIATILELADIKDSDYVLEIGAGRGYLTALLSHLTPHGKVVGVEINPYLCKHLKNIFKNKKNVEIINANARYLSLPYKFDIIISSAASREIPPPWIGMLKEGGRIIMPEDKVYYQELVIATKSNEKIRKKHTGIFVRFVELI